MTQIALTYALHVQYDVISEASWISLDGAATAAFSSPDDRYDEARIKERHYIYIKPWCRITPYVMGIALAHLYKHRVSVVDAANSHLPTNIGKVIRRVPLTLWYWLLMIFGMLVMFALVAGYYAQIVCPEPDVWPYCGHGYFTPGNWSHASRHAEGLSYFALASITWSVGICALLLCMFNGFGGIIKGMLELQVWMPLSRLTYVVYLLHPMIIMWQRFSLLAIPPHSLNNIFPHLLYNTLACYFSALVVYLVIEKPIMNITTSLLLGDERLNPKKN